MEPFNVSILVVNCKDYKPTHDYYLCKSGRHISSVARTPEWPDYNEERRKEYSDYDDLYNPSYICHLCVSRQ